MSVSPSVAGAFFASRSRRIAQRMEERESLDKLSKQLTDKLGFKVQDGPFEGVDLPEAMANRHIGPFLLGSYESALHNAIRRFKSEEYDSIIDIGSSFGYYAVGLASLFPHVPVYAFDIDPWARRQVKNMAKRNNLDNVHVRSACTQSALKEYSNGKSLILSDCEGYEHELFDRGITQKLHQSDFVIEIHPPDNEEAVSSLSAAFKGSHDISVIESDPMSMKKAFLPTDVHETAITEYRGAGQKWLIARSSR